MINNYIYGFKKKVFIFKLFFLKKIISSKETKDLN